MIETFKRNWPKYLTEAAALACFMISACIIVVLLEYPGSSMHARIPNGTIRLYIVGAELGITAYLLVVSNWGKRSGPHMNPAFTLSFFLLGEIAFWDAFFYIIFQFMGGMGGVFLSSTVLGASLAHPSVGWVVTVPGQRGNTVAFIAEFLMSSVLMGSVLIFGSSKRLERWSPILVGLLIGGYIAFETRRAGTGSVALPTGASRPR